MHHTVSATDELVRRVVRAERFHAGRGVVARFQISPGACPEGLDALLAERGYQRESPMSLQAGAHRAGRMYLQVERDNIPALRLYERAGFSEMCGYHYRAAGGAAGSERD
ncbi:GNAT family N-acetyltransferase [Streptomyces halobius]|uniref:GNAT family N-acetyltransferase n=1 Tax=Streptomyces halobius TaxID=2879846 RepID=A0ABY4MHL6_9ACTN|nr:GNAT family N-acetyltransferase [Streptomyces halobius]UQA97296.1 GNAT family N-acetyltransferase [Streptomyces halobius]